MNGIVIQSLSIPGSCGIRENLFWGRRWKAKICYFPFLPPTNSMTKHSPELTLHLRHTPWFCRRGGHAHTESEQLSQGGEAPLRGTGTCPCCRRSLRGKDTSVSTSPAPPDGDNFSLALRAQERIITWSAGLGPFFQNKKGQRSSFIYKALTRPLFQPCLFLTK